MYSTFREAGEEIISALEHFGCKPLDRREWVESAESRLKSDTAHKIHRADLLSPGVLLKILRKEEMTASLEATCKVLYPKTWAFIELAVQHCRR